MWYGWMQAREFTEGIVPTLPRPYPAWRDPACWVTLGAMLPLLLFGACLDVVLWQQGPWTWPVFAVGGLLLAHPAACLWMAADSYRWVLPNRGMYLSFCVLLPGLFWMYYLGSLRPGWLMHVQREKHRMANLSPRERELAELSAALRVDQPPTRP